MKGMDNKAQTIDTDPMYDDRETVTDAAEQMDEQQRADNMSDGAAEEGDKSSQSDGSTDAEKSAGERIDWQDRYVRLAAEFDNYRKRTLREKMELVASGGEDVIKSLLGVMDDMDRAMAAMEKSDDVDSMKQGVALIHQKLLDMLRSKGVQEIEAVGAELDTDLHEAVAKFPVEDDRKGKIIDVVQKGYKLKDKVVRFAKVVVGE